MKNQKEETLIQALNYAHLHELPDKWDNKSLWIKAIGLVTRRNGGVQSYVILRREADGRICTIKDFSLDAIRSIDEVYPYIYIDSQFLPKFTTQQRDEKHEYIARISGKSIEEVKNMSAKQQKEIMVGYAMKIQLNNEPKH